MALTTKTTKAGGAVSPLSARLPLYAQVVNAVQDRIEDGTYRPGEMIPGEAKLGAEFNASRQTVVRALNMLKQEGWIESHQGKGYFVRGRPANRLGAPDYIDDLMDTDETVITDVLDVEPVLSSRRIASALRLREKTPVYQRRQLIISEETGPVALANVYVPVDVAVGTGIEKPAPIAGGLRRCIETARGVRFDFATQRISARLPSKEEAQLLALKPSAPVMTLLVALYAADGTGLAAMDTVLPADRHELEDSFPLGN